MDRRKILSVGKMNKFRIFMNRIISVICVIAVLTAGLYYCNRLLMRKDSYEECVPFFNNEQTFDVLFFGSSHVKFGISPLLLYQNYGITSYNLAILGNYIPSNYYRINEILNFLKQNKRPFPKVIVMDVFAAEESSIYRLHEGWDAFPLSANKMEMVNALAGEKERAEMLFPFSLYHSRWNELVKDDFQTNINHFYGMDVAEYVISYPKEIINDPLDQVEADAKTIKYLNQTKEICDAADIKLILIHIPYSGNPEPQRVANGICQYAEEKGIPYVNYMNMDLGIDYEIDFCDPAHLNQTGMRIMTNELGRLLSDAGMEDHRGEEQVGQWEQAYEEYINFRIAQLAEIKNIKSYLMAINDPDFISTVMIQEGMLGDVQIAKLVERLEKEGNRIDVTEDMTGIISENGQIIKYNVYCEVYRRSNPETKVHAAGFTV